MDTQIIVLDTNCLLQILPSRSKYHSIWTAILRGEVRLCVNTEILDEYEEIISLKMTPAIARLSTTYFQQTFVHIRLIEKDADDNKFVDCAIATNAHYIVSNDNHFSVLKTIEWPKVLVLNLQQYFHEYFE